MESPVSMERQPNMLWVRVLSQLLGRVGFSRQLSLGSLSQSLELSFSCSRTPLPIPEAQIFWARHIALLIRKSVLWVLFLEGWWVLPTFLSTTDVSAVPSKTYPWYWSKGTEFFAKLPCPGGLPSPRNHARWHELPWSHPKEDGSGKGLNVHPQEKITQATRSYVII